jgi:phage shock protein A
MQERIFLILFVLFLDAVEGLKKQYAQLQAKKQSIIQAIEQEEKEYEEMISTNCELREQRDKLASKLTEMKDKIEILHAEISREGASKRKQEKADL